MALHRIFSIARSPIWALYHVFSTGVVLISLTKPTTKYDRQLPFF